LKTIYALAIGAIIALAAFLWVYPFPEAVDREIPAVLTIRPLQEAGTVSREPTVIRVKGEVYRKLFRQPEYNVTVSVDGLDWTERYAMSRLPVAAEGGGIRAAVAFYMNMKPNGAIAGDHTRTASFWFDDSFKHMHFWAQDQAEEGGPAIRDLFATGEAQDAKQADERLKEIRQAFESSKEGELTGVYGPDSSS